jgi:hypothetical protein
MFGFKKAPAWSPFKSAKEHDRFVAMVLRVSAAAGTPLEATEEDGVLASKADKEVQFGLMNLAQQCAQTPTAEWEGVIGQHVRQLASAKGSTAALIDWEQAKQELKLRFYPPDVPSEGLITLPTADGFYTVLVMDKPEVVATVTPEQRAEWTVSDEELFSKALENVWDEGRLTFEPHQAGNALLRIAQGPSFFVASHALLLDRYFLHEPPYGVVVCAPTRHTLIYHEIVGGTFDAAFMGMVQWGVSAFAQGPGSVSPHLYWVRNGEWKAITTIAGNQMSFVAPPEFQSEVLNKIAQPTPK